MEVKQWPRGITFTETLPRRRVIPLSGQAGELTCERILRTQFTYVQSRGMIPRRWGGGNTRGKNAEGSKEDSWEAFQSRYTIPYLYGLVKTHKQPYGWRFISGGTNLALNLVGDWVHSTLQGVVLDAHQLAARALSGALVSEPMPCAESFIIRDSRDVVRRIRELERRRRDAYLRYTKGEGERPPHWRRVGFEVADFTTLYPSLPHTDIMLALSSLIGRIFRLHREEQVDENGQPTLDEQGRRVFVKRWMRVARNGHGERDTTGAGVSWVPGVQQPDGSFAPPKDEKNTKHFDNESLLRDIRFILHHTYMTVGDDIYRQVCGVPMGLSCSPMIANVMLAFYEVSQLRRMVAASQRPNGAMVSLPAGTVALSPQIRIDLLTLAARFSRSCRQIDDVLLIDLSLAEQLYQCHSSEAVMFVMLYLEKTRDAKTAYRA